MLNLARFKCTEAGALYLSLQHFCARCGDTVEIAMSRMLLNMVAVPAYMVTFRAAVPVPRDSFLLTVSLQQGVLAFSTQWLSRVCVFLVPSIPPLVAALAGTVFDKSCAALCSLVFFLMNVAHMSCPTESNET